MDTGLWEDEQIAITGYFHFGVFWKEVCGDKKHSIWDSLVLRNYIAQHRDLNWKLKNWT